MMAVEADALDSPAAGPNAPRSSRRSSDAVNPRPSISIEQRRAVYTITTGEAPVVMVVGHAGTGRPSLSMLPGRPGRRRARGDRRRSGGPGGPTAPIGSGIPSSDDRRAYHRPRRGPGAAWPSSVVVVDEAGMVGTRDIHRLIQATTAVSAKLVLVGDPGSSPRSTPAACSRRWPATRLRRADREPPPAEPARSGGVAELCATARPSVRCYGCGGPDI